MKRKTEGNYPGGEGSWDRHSGTQGRPEGGGRVGGGARGADHHDDPPPGLSPDELMTKERFKRSSLGVNDLWWMQIILFAT